MTNLNEIAEFGDNFDFNIWRDHQKNFKERRQTALYICSLKNSLIYICSFKTALYICSLKTALYIFAALITALYIYSLKKQPYIIAALKTALYICSLKYSLI